jgi:hypothetical protein
MHSNSIYIQTFIKFKNIFVWTSRKPAYSTGTFKFFHSNKIIHPVKKIIQGRLPWTHNNPQLLF